MKKLIGIYTSPRGHWVGDGFPVRTLFSYDSMGEEVFQDFWSKVCAYLVVNDWPTLTEEQITTMVEIEAFKEPV